MKNDRTVDRAVKLLEQHKTEIIESLGARAFDLLSPRQVQAELGIKGGRIPDLVRQGWLESAPVEYSIGSAHMYYRWRVQFVKLHKRPYGKSEGPEIAS